MDSVELENSKRNSTKVLTSMPKEKPKTVKWYSAFVLLVGTILSLADPVTDIITAVEFYRADHKIWFGVGLGFVFLHNFVALFVLCCFYKEHSHDKLLYPLCFFFGPFFCFYIRLRELVRCLKRLWNRNVDANNANNANKFDGDENSRLAVFVESLLESAPQFVLQLYVASVQEEPLEVIQILSIPVSFLSLVWTFTTTDSIIFEEIVPTWKMKHRIAILVTHLFLVSSRLLAICYFTVSYKWWVIVVFLLHGLVIATADNICNHKVGGHCSFLLGISSVLFFFIHWLRDDITVYLLFRDSRQFLWKRQLFSSCLYISENVTIILLFYFSQHLQTWYSLPVTICVCLFSVLGTVIRIIPLHRFYSRIGMILENNNNDSAGQPTSEADPRLGEGGAPVNCPPQADPSWWERTTPLKASTSVRPLPFPIEIFKFRSSEMLFVGEALWLAFLSLISSLKSNYRYRQKTS